MRLAAIGAVLFSCPPSALIAQIAGDPTAITPAHAREDLELAIAALEAGLPDIYWHQSRRAWTQAKAQARAAVAQVHDSRALYSLMLPLMTRIGEGHLSFQRSEALIRQEHEAGRFLPLDLHFSGEGIFILRGYGDAVDIPIGSRLVSIDGEGPAAIVREAMCARGTDGQIPTEAMRAAGGRGYAAFRYRLRGLETHYAIRFQARDGVVVQRIVTPIAYADRAAPAIDPRPALPTLAWLDSQTAYLSVPTFSNTQYRAAGAEFRSTIQDIFAQLARADTHDLILDLRENGGGSEPNESVLFSYLVEKPLRKYASVEARSATVSATTLSGRHYAWEVYDREELTRQRRGPHGRLYRRNLPPDGLMTGWAPVGPIFRGRLVVLAGGNTFSGAAELASMLFHSNRAVFVGEETGGTDAGNTSGYKWLLTLPNSGFRLGVPLLRFRFAWRPQRVDRGVFPQCPVPPRFDEIGRQHDAAWHVAVAILHEDWTQPAAARCPPVASD